MGARLKDEFDPKVTELIRHKVKKIIGRYGFTRDDEEDLCQELTLRVIEGMPRHDAGRASSRTFADRIVVSKLTHLIQRATATKRDRRGLRYLEDVPEPSQRHDEHSRAVGIDVREAVDALPADLSAIARLLAEHTEAEVIRLTAFTREQVRQKRREIERHFRARGIIPNSEE